MWIGSRSCRYQHNANIVLYGNDEDMESIGHAGKKFLWCSGKNYIRRFNTGYQYSLRLIGLRISRKRKTQLDIFK